jgi:hypothetical protein
MGEKATFEATLPPILSAVKVSGDGGLRIQLDVPQTDEADALKLLLWRERVLRVTVEPANDRDEPKSPKRYL